MNNFLFWFFYESRLGTYVDGLLSGPRDNWRGFKHGWLMGNFIGGPPLVLFLILHYCFGVW